MNDSIKLVTSSALLLSGLHLVVNLVKWNWVTFLFNSFAKIDTTKEGGWFQKERFVLLQNMNWAFRVWFDPDWTDFKTNFKREQVACVENDDFQQEVKSQLVIKKKVTSSTLSGSLLKFINVRSAAQNPASLFDWYLIHWRIQILYEVMQKDDTGLWPRDCVSSENSQKSSQVVSVDSSLAPGNVRWSPSPSCKILRRTYSNVKFFKKNKTIATRFGTGWPSSFICFGIIK